MNQHHRVPLLLAYVVTLVVVLTVNALIIHRHHPQRNGFISRAAWSRTAKGAAVKRSLSATSTSTDDNDDPNRPQKEKNDEEVPLLRQFDQEQPPMLIAQRKQNAAAAAAASGGGKAKVKSIVPTAVEDVVTNLPVPDPIKGAARVASEEDKLLFPELGVAGIDEKALRASPLGKVLFSVLDRLFPVFKEPNWYVVGLVQSLGFAWRHVHAHTLYHTATHWKKPHLRKHQSQSTPFHTPLHTYSCHLHHMR